jgi:hypothetical protein
MAYCAALMIGIAQAFTEACQVPRWTAESIPKTARLVSIFTSISDNLAQFAGLRVLSQALTNC